LSCGAYIPVGRGLGYKPEVATLKEMCSECTRREAKNYKNTQKEKLNFGFPEEREPWVLSG
jgi:hypothetical protein